MARTQLEMPGLCRDSRSQRPLEAGIRNRTDKVVVQSVRQPAHDTLPHQESHGIRRKRPQEARHEPPPVPPPARLPIHRLRRVLPPRKLPLAVPEPAAERVCHDALLDEVTRVAAQPEDLGAQPTRPEVDGRRAEVGARAHLPRDDVVAAPPEEEEGAEDERGGEAVEDAAHAVVPVDLGEAVDGARVEPVGLLRGVLDLQAGFDVLDRRGDEADGGAGESACHAVADGRERRLVDVEDVGGHDASINVEGAHHDGVHAHPADKGRRGSLVQSSEAFPPHCLHHTVQRSLELGGVCGLQTHLDSIKRMADWRGTKKS